MLKSIIAPFIVFLLLLGVCTILTGPLYRSHIERDLSEKIETKLHQSGTSAEDIRVSGSHLLTTKIDPKHRDELEGIIGAYIPQLALPKVPRSSWIVLEEDKENSIIIKGLIPSHDDEIALISAARKSSPPQGPGRNIINELEIADDVPALAQREKILRLTPIFLSRTDGAILTLLDGEVTLTGMVDRQEDIDAMMLGLRGNSRLNIQPYQPVDLGLSRTGESITLFGLLPDIATRTRTLALIREHAPSLQVNDHSQIAVRPARTWWFPHPETFIPTLLTRSEGPANLHFKPNEFHFQGEFPEQKDISATQKKISRFPIRIVRQTSLTKPRPTPIIAQVPQSPPVNQEDSLSPDQALQTSTPTDPAPIPPAQETGPQDPLAAELKLLPIYFNSSSTYLKPSEWEKVDQAVEIILANPERKLLVGGYADLRGDPQTNKSLALKRAREVRKRLIKKGVPSKQLVVDHFGADESITNPADHWKGRRVEIALSPESPTE